MVRQFDGRHVRPFKLETFEGTCRLRANELTKKAYASYVAQTFVPFGVGCYDGLLRAM